MNYSTFNAILSINKHFYNSVAEDFNNTRKRVWKTSQEIIQIALRAHGDHFKVLDVACGNGRFLDDLNKAKVDYTYLGIDFNEYLLQQAKQRHQNEHTRFKKLDIMDLITIKSSYDLIVCFGVMHHLPSEEFRYKFLEDLVEILDDKGILALGFFDLLEDPRFKSKLLPEDKVLSLANSILQEKISKLDLEGNDYFLGWSNKNVARYCHYYSLKEKTEIQTFLEDKGIKLIEKIYSDGVSESYFTYYIFQKA